MCKSEAWAALDKLLSVVNAAKLEPGSDPTIEAYITLMYLPCFTRRWKRSTQMSNVNRIHVHIVGEFGRQKLAALRREELQQFLDLKAKTLSFIVVDHLKWDLMQLFEFAVAEGMVPRNRAAMLFTPKEAKKSQKRVMSLEEVELAFFRFGSSAAANREVCDAVGDASRRNLWADVGESIQHPRSGHPAGVQRRHRHAENARFGSQGGTHRRFAG